MKFFEKLKNNKAAEYVLLAVLSLAVIMIFAFSFIKPTSANTNESSAVDAYVKDLENRLNKTLSQINGAGKVSVVITVESGMETVIATEKTSVTQDGKTTVTEVPVLVNGKVVVLKENYPKITGVLIVAQGASNIMVMQNIQQAALSLLDIELSQIEILTMK